ncbi:MerR family transcriptional regulator [Rhodococcus sp. HNM0569]|uniref:MerR family transcriptional regulator n=1 Tax=Rhodococcus sp. HNM0569 TaxID=2716340 RepID=UPI00146E14F0|nr:MerR family transcriptional regulator [Rhodococcus sp. HNM0569]NLU85151.1 MerR family transcriptional regulator [Rhodococcus sp. HNM0569]
MAEYRIDDLARLAQVSVRNIRVYQDRGLLPPPRKQGRTGWYSDAHLDRLELIGRMLDRGYTFATISELLTAARYGLEVRDVLATDESRWTQRHRESRVTAEELRASLGSGTTDEAIAHGEALGVVVRDGVDASGTPVYAVPDRGLLDAAEMLVDAGISIDELLAQFEAVRHGLGDVAARFVALVADRYLPPDGDDLDLDESTVKEAAELIDHMRPLAHDTIGSMFAKAMEAEIAKALAEAARRLANGEPATGTGDTQAS